MPESILQPLDTPGGRIWRCPIFRKSVKPLFLPLQVTLTSYGLSETGWLPLVTTVTYGYIWLHMVTGGYRWLQATVLTLPDETLYERGARDDQLPSVPFCCFPC